MFYGRSASVFCIILDALFWMNGYSLLTSNKVPKTHVSLNNVEASFSDDVKLQCRFPNDTFPKGKVEWYKNNVLLNNTNDKHIIRKTGKILKFNRIRKGDDGIYSCRDAVKNAVIIAFNISVQQLPLQYKLKFKYLDKILKQRTTVKPAGSDVIFDCTAVGVAPMNYTWFKGGVPFLTRRDDSNLVLNKPTLKLFGVVRSDSAKYMCVVENKFGNISSNMLLFVQERVRASPYIEKATMKNQTRYVGDNVSIVCYELITGTVPDFYWMKWTVSMFNESLLHKTIARVTKGRSVDAHIARIISKEFHRATKKVAYGRGPTVCGVEYMLTNVTQKDSGFYTCIASNHIGTDYATMHLLVKENKKNKKNKKKEQKTNDKKNRYDNLQRRFRDYRNNSEIIMSVLGVLLFIALSGILLLLVRWKRQSNMYLEQDDVKLSNFDEGCNVVEKLKPSEESIQTPLLSVGSDEVNAEHKGLCEDDGSIIHS